MRPSSELVLPLFASLVLSFQNNLISVEGYLNSVPVSVVSKNRIGLSSSSTTTTRIYATREETQKRTTGDKTSILEDGEGHINPELASMMWNWEQQQRESAKLPKMSYSSRSGLRLVKEIVTEIIHNNRDRILKGSSSSSNSKKATFQEIESDLIQEGMIALMDVMIEYRKQEEKEQQLKLDHLSKVDDQKHFESIAKIQIKKCVLASLEHDFDGMIPKTIIPAKSQMLLDLVTKLKAKLTEMNPDGIEPSSEELASRVGITHDTLLELYEMSKQRRPLSMESTVEIINPHIQSDTERVSYQDQEDWEYNDGHVLVDMSSGLYNKNEELVDEYMDEDAIGEELYEGDDNMWEHQEQIVGPLRELIPDEEGPKPDDMALLEMLKYDVSQFLSSTLNSEQEVQIVRMRFGLDTGKPISQTEIGKTLGISPIRTHHLLIQALDKLRLSYRNRYVEEYLEIDDEDEDLVTRHINEDTV